MFIAKDFYKIGNNWLRKNDLGVWEMYLEGNAYERGVIHGKLTKELITKQEEAFVNHLNQEFPSSIYRQFLKLAVTWFNNNIDQVMPVEYQEEIAGLSRYVSSDYDYMAPPYQRMLNYHAVYDIAHVLPNLSELGASSFAAWNELSGDSSLIVGRNLDFLNDDFAKEKIVCFVNPSQGHKFITITWAGMIGVFFWNE